MSEATASDAMSAAKEAKALVASHEAVCAERYKALNEGQTRIEQAIRDNGIGVKQDMLNVRGDLTSLGARVGSLETARAANLGARSLAVQVREWLPTAAYLIGGALLLLEVQARLH